MGSALDIKAKKIKVGYLPLYIKLYDDSNAHYRDPMVEYMHTLISMLETHGIEVVAADVCRIKPEFDAAAKMFNDADVDAVVTQHLAYSPSLESIDALLSLKAPIIVFDTTLDYELVDNAAYHNGISANHGIHGVMDMCNMLRQHGRSFEICAGHAMHSDVVAELAGLCRAAAVKKGLQTARVGAVGGDFDGMGDFHVTPEHYKDSIGAEVVTMTKAASKKYVAAVTDAEVEDEVAWDKEHFEYKITDEKSYLASVKSGLAVRKWAEDNKLSACTVNFLRLDKCGLPKMPFAECCKMLARGMGYAGEGDVLTAGLVGALRAVYPDTNFVEMFCPDWKQDIILLSHMGEFNLNIADSKPWLCTTPFNYNSCGDTAAPYGCMRAGKATYVNLAPMGEGYSLVVTPVEMLSVDRPLGVYRTSVRGWMKPCKPLRQFLPEFSRAGATHHSALVYNVGVEEIAAFGRMMGFAVTVID